VKKPLSFDDIIVYSMTRLQYFDNIHVLSKIRDKNDERSCGAALEY
jgi:hypothetical protein